jgi:hypothetical protein
MKTTLCIAWLLALAVCCGAAEKILKAGAAAANITPAIGGTIVGGFSPFPSKHIHDELHARCLVLDDGSTRLAFVVIDNLAVGREVLDEAKKRLHATTGLPVDRMLMSSTHTHSAVSARSVNVVAPPGPLSDYQQFLVQRIHDGVIRAINNLEPARIAWGTADEPRQVFNRRWFMNPAFELRSPLGEPDQVKMNPPRGSKDLREPAGPVDPQIVFLSVQSASGRPIALLANYSLHYVGGVGPGHISADYFALFADRIQQLLNADRLDPPFVGIMSNGTSGNINNINFRVASARQKPYEQMRIVADQVADAVFQASKSLQYRDWVELKMAQRELELAVRKPTPQQLARAQSILAAPAADKAGKPANLERIYAERAMHQQQAPPTVSVILQAARVGDVGIAAIPFETFVETGLEIKEKSPFKPSFTFSIANGGYGYLPTPEHHDLGGYETWLGTSKVERDASVKITRTLLDMLQELR